MCVCSRFVPAGDDLSAAQAAELDFRTSFPTADALPDLDAELQHEEAQDSTEFDRILLSHADKEAGRDGEVSPSAVAAAVAHATAVARARAYDEVTDEDAAVAAAAVDDVGLKLPVTTEGDDSTDHGGDDSEMAVNSKDRCRYYGKNRARCPRVATGFDGRCAIHKHSQFCKHPRCNKFNQGNGYCIKHGGGKKCKHDGCEKQVQGYGYCSGHGGKPLCPVEGCENKRMEGGYVRHMCVLAKACWQLFTSCSGDG